MGYIVILIIIGSFSSINCDEYAKKLYSSLVEDYNKLVRPVKNNKDVVTVSIDLKLSRLIDIDEKNQIMTTNVWLTQIWNDYRFTWRPEEYNNITSFNLPVNEIWIPDLVLHNTANGKYEFEYTTKAEIKSNGQVTWKLPSILKSSCLIDVEHFPFDIQSCHIALSSWTYDLNHVFLTHIKAKKGELFIEDGFDVKNCSESDEWDIVDVAAILTTEPANFIKDDFFPNIKFCLILKRKTLFYMVNLITPCISLSFLTVLVFLLSSNSGEKITLCISVLLALTFFFLLLLDIMPPTSLVMPMLGKYLVFTITMVSLSICATIYILNIHYRTPELYKEMPNLVRTLFLNYLPKFLMLEVINNEDNHFNSIKSNDIIESSMNNIKSLENIYKKNALITREESTSKFSDFDGSNLLILVESDASSINASKMVNKVRTKKKVISRSVKLQRLIIKNIKYLTQIVFFIKRDYNSRKIVHEWKLLAHVLDRLLLFIFGFSFVIGTFLIYFQSGYHRLTAEKKCSAYN